MFSGFEWMVALRYLRARRQEGFISVIAIFSLLGIALGVATLIIVMSVMNGFRAELLDRILGLNGHFVVRSTQGPLVDYQPLADELSGIEGVVRVTPLVEGQVMATSSGAASGALVRGMRAQDLKAHEIIASNIIEGSFEAYEQGEGIVIGYRLARTLGVRPGGKISLISPEGRVTAVGMVPRIRAYEVAAVFDVGMFEYDSGYIFMPLPAAQAYFRTGDGVSSLELMGRDADSALGLRMAIASDLGPGMRLIDWQRSNASFFNALQVERNVMFLILTLIILVAAFNIISSMIMLVKDKGQDIAILRTMGATRGMVMRIFLIAGASVGVIGTLAGFLLGVGFCRNIDAIKTWLEGLTGTELFAAEIYFLSHLPAKMDPAEVIIVVAMALSLSFLATLYPSWRAARLDPVEALRYE